MIPMTPAAVRSELGLTRKEYTAIKSLYPGLDGPVLSLLHRPLAYWTNADRSRAMEIIGKAGKPNSMTAFGRKQLAMIKAMTNKVDLYDGLNAQRIEETGKATGAAGNAGFQARLNLISTRADYFAERVRRNGWSQDLADRLRNQLTALDLLRKDALGSGWLTQPVRAEIKALDGDLRALIAEADGAFEAIADAQPDPTAPARPAWMQKVTPAMMQQFRANLQAFAQGQRQQARLPAADESKAEAYLEQVVKMLEAGQIQSSQQAEAQVAQYRARLAAQRQQARLTGGILLVTAAGGVLYFLSQRK